MRTNGVEGAKDQVEESNGSTEFLIKLQDDSGEGAAGLDELLVAEGPVGIDVLGDLGELASEEELSEGDQIHRVGNIVQRSLLLEEDERQRSLAEAQVKEGGSRGGSSGGSSRNYELARDLTAKDLHVSVSAKVIEPSDDSVSSLLHRETGTELNHRPKRPRADLA